MSSEEKRLFFGLEILSPWPKEMPQGRSLAESDRHLTLAFLGQTDYTALKAILSSLPKPPFSVGFVGRFDQCLFLPERTPRVVAWHAEWLEDSSPLELFQKELVKGLKEHGFPIANSDREFLPHVTLCRQPFSVKEWKQGFRSLPFMTKSLHLYESLGHSHYAPCWTYPIPAPFDEIEHTADIAFSIRGNTFAQLHRHAQIALAFKFPAILPYLSLAKGEESIEDIVIDLNRSIGLADQEVGSPLKAVSFHDKLTKSDQLWAWEMIVDV